MSAIDASAIDRNPQSQEVATPRMRQDVIEMLYGFGDEWPSDQETVDVAMALVTDYINNLADMAKGISEMTGRIDKECFLFLVRKDAGKYTRAQRLLDLHEELKTVKHTHLSDDQEAVAR